jgi:hypothetical protein
VTTKPIRREGIPEVFAHEYDLFCIIHITISLLFCIIHITISLLLGLVLSIIKNVPVAIARASTVEYACYIIFKDNWLEYNIIHTLHTLPKVYCICNDLFIFVGLCWEKNAYAIHKHGIKINTIKINTNVY